MLTKDEAGTLFHFPNDEINISGVDWTHFDTGPSVPYGTPRYNFESAGVPTDEATTAEQQLAMVDHPEHGDAAIWLGRGRNEGIETGVFEEFLNAHIQITGRTRMGKTTLATNIGSQAMERGYCALAIMLGKEDDDEAFIAEWPEDRPQEDFVFIDTGDEFDQRVRFNLLEIPDHLEAGTAEHTSYMESLADDFCAAFAQAGGGEGTLYPLMRGITRTVVRGMAQSEMTCTPLDLAAACSSADNIQRFSQWMSDERIHFIKETAARFEEKEDADLEPIARRMDEIVQNGNLRTLLSARDPSTRIQEIVDEGKVAVLRIDEALGETERKFVTTPIVRRFAHAKKMSNNDDPYYCLWDEADKAVSSHSNLAQMLSEYGGYDFRFCLLYQAPSSQLPDDITNATESQIDTTISFRTTGKDARFIQHQHSVDADDLDRLPRYSFYMNTDTKRNDPTESYMVDAFPPIREVRQQVGGTDPMTDEAITRMKRESAARYGGEPETAEEIKANSQFYTTSSDTTSDADEGEDNTDEDGPIDVAEQALYEAIYTVQIRHAAIGEYVDTTAVIDEWRRRVSDDELGFASEVSNVIEQAPEEYIERQRRGGDTVLRLTPEGRQYAGLQQDTGSSASGGGNEHRWVLTQAYRAFTKLGMFVELPTQEGEEDPDGLAELPIDPMAGDDIREIHAREERLQEEYPYLAGLTDGMNISIEAETSTIKKPMQTLTNLRKAIDSHRLCVFACKDGSAEHDEFGYWARRGEQIIYDTTNGEIDDDRLTFAPETDEQGNRRFYNTTNQFALEDGMYALRRDTGDQTDLVWYEDGTEMVMGDDNGTKHARFESSEAVDDPSQKDVPAYYEYDTDNEEYVVRAGGEKLYYTTIEEMLSEWTRVYAPFIPDTEFERLPTPEDLLFVVFPDEDTEEYDEPMIYEQGNLRPLLPSDIPWNATETPPDDGVDANSEPEPPESEPAPAASTDPEGAATPASNGGSEAPPAEESAVSEMTEDASSERESKAESESERQFFE